MNYNYIHKNKQQRLSVSDTDTCEAEDDYSSNPDDEIDFNDISEQGFTRLTNLVRTQYLTFLKKLLNENLTKWLNEQDYDANSIPLENIEKCALLFEKRAVRASMIVELYRRHMLRIITEIRRDTKHGKLVKNLQNFTTVKCKSKQYDDKSRDLELNEMRFECFTLQEKIHHFQAILNEKEKKRNEEKEKRMQNGGYQKRKHSPINHNRSPFTPSSSNNREKEEDDIEKELEELFGQTNDPIEEIFGDESESTTKIEVILKEIEQAELPCDNSKKHEKPEAVPNTESNNNNFRSLHESLWPCECYIRRRKLRDILNRVADTGLRQHEMIRLRFMELFGEDSEDEFAPYSPSLEVDSVVISSCMKRIAPWIVKYLMGPLKDGMIGNRFLFKKLAKRLAYSIVMRDMYPDEETVRIAVADFFHYKRYIGSMEDIEIY